METPIIQPPILTPEQIEQIKTDMANDTADKMKNPKPIPPQFHA